MSVEWVVTGDALEELRQIPDGYVDLVFTSPPYEDARTYGIDFKLKGEEFVSWCEERYMECRRVCKGLVAWVIEGKTRKYRYSATPLLLAANLHRRGVHLRKPPIFHRIGVPGSGGPDWWRNDYEFVICSGPGGKLPWSDNTATGHPPKWAPGGEMSNRLSDGTRRNQWGHSGQGSQGARRKDGSRGSACRPSHEFVAVREHTKRMADGSLQQQQQHYTVPVKANPGNVTKQTYTAEEVAEIIEQYEGTDVRRYLVGGGVMGDKLCHENEAPFPEKLAEDYIKSFCPPGGIVLDPFGGSGTTAKVAKWLGRGFISIDLREEMTQITKRRLALVEEDASEAVRKAA